MFLRLLAPILTISLLLGGCSSTPQNLVLNPSSPEYCGRYFVYHMCAQDISGDGKVDVMYFEDSLEVFMYRPGSALEYGSKLVLHPCAQVMDEGLRNAADQLLGINSDTGFFQKADIKSGLLVQYLRYSPRINKCHKSDTSSVATNETEDPFSDFPYEDFDE